MYTGSYQIEQIHPTICGKDLIQMCGKLFEFRKYARTPNTLGRRLGECGLWPEPLQQTKLVLFGTNCFITTLCTPFHPSVPTIDSDIPIM